MYPSASWPAISPVRMQLLFPAAAAGEFLAHRHPPHRGDADVGDADDGPRLHLGHGSHRVEAEQPPHLQPPRHLRIPLEEEGPAAAGRHRPFPGGRSSGRPCCGRCGRPPAHQRIEGGQARRLQHGPDGRRHAQPPAVDLHEVLLDRGQARPEDVRVLAAAGHRPGDGLDGADEASRAFWQPLLAQVGPQQAQAVGPRDARLVGADEERRQVLGHVPRPAAAQPLHVDERDFRPALAEARHEEVLAVEVGKGNAGVVQAPDGAADGLGDGVALFGGAAAEGRRGRVGDPPRQATARPPRQTR